MADSNTQIARTAQGSIQGNNIKVKQYFGKANENNSHSIAKESKPIPVLLPYMPNRTEQDEALEDAISQIDSKFPLPVVCLIHGDEYQCQDMLLRRFLDKSLPEMLCLAEDKKIERYRFDWPTDYNSKEELRKKLEKNLLISVRKNEKWLSPQRDEISEKRESLAKYINQQFASHPVPVLIDTHLMTQHWSKHGVDTLMWFLEYWQQHWPPLMPGQRLFVCWSIKYELKQFSLWKKWRLNRINNKIKALLELSVSVATQPFYSSYNRLICKVIPELKNITRQDAENWARDEETMMYCSSQKILEKIREIYYDWERKTSLCSINMEELARRLNDSI